MLNIEIHGFVNEAYEDYPARIARQVGQAVAEKTDLAEEVVITVHKDRVFSCTRPDAVDQPFIRICSARDEDFTPLIEALEPLGFDIETLKLRGFLRGSHPALEEAKKT